MRCRICDAEVQNPKIELSDDQCCKVCVAESEDLFEDTDADAIAALLIEDDILYLDCLLEGSTSDYE